MSRALSEHLEDCALEAERAINRGLAHVGPLPRGTNVGIAMLERPLLLPDGHLARPGDLFVEVWRRHAHVSRPRTVVVPIDDEDLDWLPSLLELLRSIAITQHDADTLSN